MIGAVLLSFICKFFLTLWLCRAPTDIFYSELENFSRIFHPPPRCGVGCISERRGPREIRIEAKGFPGKGKRLRCRACGEHPGTNR